MADESLSELGRYFAQLMVDPLSSFRDKILTGSSHVTELWQDKRCSLQPIFQQICVVSDLTGWQSLGWRHYAWFSSVITTPNLWYCNLNFWRSSEVMTLNGLMLPTVAIFCVLMSWDRKRVSFSHTPFSCPFTLANVNRRHWLCLPSGEFSDDCDVIPFRDAMRHKYWIKIPQNITFLGMNGAHHDES